MSPGVQSDDKIASDLGAFEGAEVVITEKMDGENTTLYADGFHARSLDSGRHPSRDWLARFQAERGYLIPPGWRICGENLYARHALAYEDLPAYFLGFSVWNDANDCLSWDETLARFTDWNVEPVRTLWRGTFGPTTVLDVTGELNLDQVEGCVIRLASAFQISNFQRSVMKWVRPGHVQPGAQHWSKCPMIPNGLSKA
ncbi:RNA ligase family protein [Roseobacter sp. CCS2]|uniref:RNA ligase family protein n=1 Tax=Roseobacter sp. CCS2 TaxID=391593 RepID=UPI0000F40180|nr:RNA ligase family protein [Roseobacter sp. CCS2]EBA13361.1 hypothetical protein RCCS2_05729 [Roseobacter sp. CCS2]